MQNFLNAMRAHDLRKATVGFDTHTAPGFEVFRFRKLNPEITMIENDEILSELRMVKSPDEVAHMKKENDKLKTENKELDRRYHSILKQLEKHTKRAGV